MVGLRCCNRLFLLRFLEVLVLNPSHGVAAVKVFTLTEDDYIFSGEEMKKLERVTLLAVEKVLKR